jgi:lysophospholipid acyltransferase (LPLAT)-like uncharacterized protein
LPPRAIIVLWHEHLPACIRVFAHLGINVLISESSDGAWAAEACERFGFRVHRGSTSRGGAAGLRAMARSLGKDRGWAGMALDGPRGPRREAKIGSLWLSRRHGIPLVPVIVKAKPGFRLKSWDRCLAPFPFARIEVLLGKPFLPASCGEIDAAMRALEAPLLPADIYIPDPQLSHR